MNIQIEIRTKSGVTVINSRSFNHAILRLIEEKCWNEYDKKDELRKKLTAGGIRFNKK